MNADRIASTVCLALLVLLASAGSYVLSERSAQAATQLTGYAWEVGISGQVITNPTTATFLTVPTGAEHAWINVKGNPACWGADATAPTATSGGEWPVSFFKIDNDNLLLKSIRVINCAEGATTVKVYYTKRRRP